MGRLIYCGGNEEDGEQVRGTGDLGDDRKNIVTAGQVEVAGFELGESGEVRYSRNVLNYQILLH